MSDKMRFVDLHCDTIVCEVMQSHGEKRLRSNPTGHLDLERLKKAGSLVQAFALYIDKYPSREGYFDDDAGPWAFFNAAADWFDREMADNSDLVAPIDKYADIAKNAAEGKISALLTVEDGVPVEGSLDSMVANYTPTRKPRAFRGKCASRSILRKPARCRRKSRCAGSRWG